MWIHNPTTNNSSDLAWGGWCHDLEAIRNWFCTPLVWLKDVESGGWILGNPFAERCIDELQIWDPERFEAWRVHWFSLSIEVTPKSSACRSLRHYRAALEMLGTCDSYRRSIGLHVFCWFTVRLQMDWTCSSYLFMLLKHKRCLESRSVLPDADWQSRECRYPGHARHLFRVLWGGLCDEAIDKQLW